MNTPKHYENLPQSLYLTAEEMRFNAYEFAILKYVVRAGLKCAEFIDAAKALDVCELMAKEQPERRRGRAIIYSKFQAKYDELAATLPPARADVLKALAYGFDAAKPKSRHFRRPVETESAIRHAINAWIEAV